VVMPHISGMQLIERLTVGRPEMKVLCMSGYTGEAALRHGMVDSNIPFVQKPLTPETLLIKVRQVLDHEPGTTPSLY
jgi:two-component system cell cycle sensor histidine kinase/response regulator CckA